MSAPLYGRWAPPKSILKSSPASVPAPKPQVVTSPGVERKPLLKDAPIESPKPAGKQMKKRKRDTANLDHTASEEDEVPKKHKGVLSKSGGAPGPTPEELHDLIPLLQPAPVPEASFEPTFSSLPHWLANPITVDSSHTVPFSELGVHPTFISKLEKQGMTDALAVQSVLFPMLHPGLEQHLGDVCVSARTGSGKTLAYMLPIIESLKDRVITTLSAIIVVPTRQLVEQARKVAEELCIGTKLKVGTAVGSVPFPAEQRLLVKRWAQYNPERAKELHARATEQMRTGFIERGGILDDLMDVPINHIPKYDSNIDILICTPGRLVEHVESTTGFLLRSVRWLVIDEADKLLDQNFQGWATTLMDALRGETPPDLASAQETIFKRRSWPTRPDVTKLVLSATMKKDLTKLGSLRFKRPKLVLVQNDTKEEVPLPAESDTFELPTSLFEYAVPVGRGADKPLYLLYLLQHHIFPDTSDPPSTGPMTDSDESDFSSESSSDNSSSSEDLDRQSKRPEPISKVGNLKNHSGRVLVFTNSNESASRLSHLLSVLHPPLKDVMKSKKLLEAFSQGNIKVLLASDLASRGLDILDLPHVINYDMPSSVTSYVHRVGRTARAGKVGEAWTFFTKTEAAWYWNDIAKGDTIKRGTNKVERVEWYARTVTWDKRRTYEKALKELQGAVEGNVECAD
ncbi:P-loop containing nucleoside triphosphate hydrolase protein [Clohesyomyces aquaticus]|uniref:ATP-dependent RNA helicase n=1 Tax=Clohesyomyces aquaticus TaxID=1231657 RepID=A0A1Y1ZUC3_9PLEO|nr:P-loop containing nucleoside triphosphate hydrolase protein [Clohesyomyces aquaticus]